MHLCTAMYIEKSSKIGENRLTSLFKNSIIICRSWNTFYLYLESDEMKDINKINDLTGKMFGRLTVIEVAQTETRKTYWKCLCKCGNYKIARSDSLQCGAITSCGCLKAEQDRINLIKNHSHKMSGTRLYNEWQRMKGRCLNKNNPDYMDYGGRGITICEEWKKDFSKFKEWAMENGYSDKLSIDRIDNNKGYSPDNCRWADDKTQANNRRSNIKVTIGTETKSLKQWCEMYGLDYSHIHYLVKKNPNMPIDELILSKVNTEVIRRPLIP